MVLRMEALLYNHKTMHKKFKYGLPLILIIQIILIGYLSK